uniref:Cytochrome c oxidase subunit 2 n=1 Tax=Capillidium heterosporum TaxID=1167838 RepID=A0A3S5HWR7_9FUNG|nr:cytochrome c oxidase subunit 2 [Capillidium heterosporum]AZZ06713.1 cytochrome c oxidase subunit 2 [Capillidium heterosporum]
MKYINRSSSIIINDAPEPWQLGFQDSASPIAEGILKIHNEILFYLIIILVLICWILTSIIVKYNENSNKFKYKYLNHGTLIELIWTITPALILIAIAIPSFKLLYLMDKLCQPWCLMYSRTHQWYWTTEYSDYVNESDNIEFDSYMVPTSDLKEGELRLLEVDNRVIVPVDTHVRVIVTSDDVIHSLALPSLGVKIDCIPGRLNQSSFIIKREGVYYGQCSELCGINHGFMPIVVEGVSLEKYLVWLNEQLEG